MKLLISIIFGILITAYKVNGKSLDLDELNAELEARSNDEVAPPTNDHDEAKRNNLNGKSVDLEEFVEDLEARSNDEVDPPSNDHDEAKKNEELPVIHHKIPCFLGTETDEYKMKTECIKAHNLARALHGVSSVVWDTTLAKNAKVWANKMAFDRKMYHSQFPNVGENVAYNMYGVSSPSSVVTPASIMIMRWYNEIRCYDFAKGGRKSSCDSSKMIGHLTAMIWKGVKKIGCGLATSPQEGTKHKTYLACQYSPIPNLKGQYLKNVLPPINGIPNELEAQDLVGKECCDYMSTCKKYKSYCNNPKFGFVKDLCARTCQDQCK